MLRVVNFAHGAMYMLGAFATYYGATLLHLPFFAALIVAPIVVGLFGIALERGLLRRLYALDPIYNLLLTFALVLVIENVVRYFAGALGSPYAIPDALSGATQPRLHALPDLQAVRDRRRAADVRARLVRRRAHAVRRADPRGDREPGARAAFGIDTGRLVTLTFGAGVALAALAGVLAAPTTNVQPDMGDAIIIYTFAIVVIGGLGSILGSILAGFILGVVQAFGTVVFPPISTTLIFIVMVVVIVFRPAGLFGKVEGGR